MEGFSGVGANVGWWTKIVCFGGETVGRKVKVYICFDFVWEQRKDISGQEQEAETYSGYGTANRRILCVKSTYE